MNERRVLIVDDSLTIRRLAERVLRQEGFLTDTAESIAETIVKVPLFRPDIILLDYVLPDGVGTDACRALLASPATESIPVVLISAKGGDIRQLYIDLPNVVDFVTKPFTPAVLVSMVGHILQLNAKGGRRAVRELGDGPERHADAGDDTAGWLLASSLLLAGRTRLLPLDRVLDACQRDGGNARLEIREGPTSPLLLTLWLDGGRVVWSRPARGSLTLRSVRERLADLPAEALAAAARSEGESGTGAIGLLFRQGLISEETAVALAREVASECLLECMDSEDLAFAIYACAASPAEAEGLQAGLGPDQVRMARLRRADAWHVIEEVLPSLDVVPVRTADAARQAARMGLNAEEERLLARVDGTLSVRELAAASGGTVFDVCRVLYRLVEGGLVRAKQRRGEGDPSRVHRVLVVDGDDERVYPGIIEALSEAGRGIEVRCHREALGRVPWTIRVFQPDALLLDVRLDGLDAVKLVKLLRQSAEFHSMLIVATGENLSEDESRHLLRVGFSQVLPKPFLAGHLCSLLLGEVIEPEPVAEPES